MDPDDPSPTADPACPNCGGPLPGAYCPSCGERRLAPDEFSLRRFVVDGAREALDVDGRVGGTLRALFFRPGELTRAYMEGRRVRYLGPVRVFLLANLIYFLVQPLTGFNGYNTTLASHMDRQVYSDAAGIRETVRERVRERVEIRTARILADDEAMDSATAREQAAAIESVLYPEQFDTMGSVYARSLVALMIPALVLLVWLVNAGRGSLVLQHVVFATHLQAWTLLFIGAVFLLLLGTLTRLGLAAVALTGADPLAVRLETPLGVAWGLIMEHGALPLVVAWVTLAFRRAYGHGWVGAGARAAVVVVGSLFAVFAYRYLLFWVTYVTV